MYIPNKGDVIWLDFEPSAGLEIRKRRPAFVISRKELNEHIGMCIVAPITSTKKGIAIEVELKSSMSTEGAILVHQLRSFDFTARNAEFIEAAPADVTEKVGKIVKLITD